MRNQRFGPPRRTKELGRSHFQKNAFNLNRNLKSGLARSDVNKNFVRLGKDSQDEMESKSPMRGVGVCKTILEKVEGLRSRLNLGFRDLRNDATALIGSKEPG